jgi:hypothetical protein
MLAAVSACGFGSYAKTGSAIADTIASASRNAVIFFFCIFRSFLLINGRTRGFSGCTRQPVRPRVAFLIKCGRAEKSTINRSFIYYTTRQKIPQHFHHFRIVKIQGEFLVFLPGLSFSKNRYPVRLAGAQWAFQRVRGRLNGGSAL